jgi:hypothetical protein
MKTAICCLMAVIVLIIMMGCSNGGNPMNPTDKPTDFTGLSNEGPGDPAIPEEGITVKVEAHPSFIGVAYVGYPMEFRAIAWKDGEIVGYVTNLEEFGSFGSYNGQNFTWEGGVDQNGVLNPTTTGEITLSVAYKGIWSEPITVNVIEPKISEIRMMPYGDITIRLGGIFSPLSVMIYNVGGGFISADPTRVTWVGGPDENGEFQPTQVGTYEIYARAENGVESEHMFLTVLEPLSP